ncbi:MAG: glycoside hydrolase family 26 protein [Chitinophagaceae bacterium]|jgi:hypothetical protein|nr:glycoside hydrolase family 26 protein [Chitinophagaceae bacterium]
MHFNLHIFLLGLGSAIVIACFGQTPTCNPNTTAATKALFTNMQQLAGNAVLFGHQDDLAYGVGWAYESGQSDVKKLTGHYPALFGWELGNLELGHTKNLDSVPFDAMRNFIRQGYAMGGVITISWHANNPLTGKSAWDPTPGTVTSVLPGGAKHALMMDWLKRVADFLESLKDAKGNAIPVLFRPWHELTGNWFWWCQHGSTPEEFKALWKMTFDYMVNDRKLNHLLWVYNTSGFDSKQHFLERYPGSNYVDIVSYDDYQNENQIKQEGNDFVKKNRNMLSILQSVSEEQKKPMAIAEVGFETIPKSNWWTNDLLPLLTDYKVSYVMLWRNAGKMPGKEKLHYYIPYPGDVSADDFKVFSQHPAIWLSNRVKGNILYKNK